MGRIIQLGDTPVTEPRRWSDLSPCAYEAPGDPDVAALLEQDVAGERFAVDACKELMDATKGQDLASHNMALTMLRQEVEHDENLDLFVLRGNP